MVRVTETWLVEPSGPLRGDIEVRGSKNAVTKHMVAAMRQGRVDSVVDEFVEAEATQVPAKLFRPRVLDNAMEIVRRGVREELMSFQADDPGRNVFLFLLYNDQSQKLNS